MANISSPGIGSGIDVNSLVSSLISAERKPATSRLDLKEATSQAQLSAYGSLKGALSSFNSTLNLLSNVDAFQSISANSDNSDVFTATADNTAAEGSYSIKVSSLSQAHTLATTGFANVTDVVGTGTLQFKFGTTVYDQGTDAYTSFTQNADQPTQTITIDSSNNTLQGLRDAVNDANIGVKAAIINDGTNNRLTFTSNAGANNSLEISVNDTGDSNDTDTSGLSRLAFNSSATNLEQTLAGQDAALTINGLAVTSASNTVKDAITGLTLNLKQAQLAADSAVMLNVDHSDSKVSDAVGTFVSKYNELLTTVNDLSSYDAAAKKGGILNGDSVIRNITSQMRRVINDTITGLSSPFTSLAEIGVRTERDGSLTLDNTTLDAAIAQNSDAVARLFAATGQVDDSNVNFIGSSSSTQAGTYAINITQAATQGIYLGSANSTLTVSAGSDTFSVSVDGVLTGALTLTAQTYASGTALAAEIQARINGDKALTDAGSSVTVNYVSDHLEIISNRYGDASKVVVSSNTTSGLGLTGGTSTDGVNVEGTIGGQAATGSGRILKGSGVAIGLELEILDTTLGDHGAASYARGIADRLNGLVDKFLASDGSVAAKLKGITADVADVGVQREQLDKRMQALESRLLAQFSTLDLLVSKMNTTSNFLAQQLGSLGSSSTGNKNK